ARPAGGPRVAVRAGARRIFRRERELRGRSVRAAGEHLAATPAALAASRVAGVGEVLQLRQDEARDDERAAHESAAHDVGDATVDDHRGVEEHALVPGAAVTPWTAHLAHERLELVALDRARRRADEPERRRTHKRGEAA